MKTAFDAFALAICVLFNVCITSATGRSAEPMIVGHRGMLLDAPENTLPNFRACLELRIGFEFDVEKTRDGHLVCIHDKTVDRTTNGSGKVSDLTLAEIRELDAGEWFDQSFKGEKVPTVEEVLNLIAKHRHQPILVAVDLKADDVGKEVVKMAEDREVSSKLVFIGRTIVDSDLRDEIKNVSTQAKTAVVANTVDEFASAVAAANADWVYFRYLPTNVEIQTVRRQQKQAFIAGPTVSGRLEENWKHCEEVGLDAILTDYPLQLRRAISTPTRAKSH